MLKLFLTLLLPFFSLQASADYSPIDPTIDENFNGIGDWTEQLKPARRLLKEREGVEFVKTYVHESKIKTNPQSQCLYVHLSACLFDLIKYWDKKTLPSNSPLPWDAVYLHFSEGKVNTSMVLSGTNIILKKYSNDFLNNCCSPCGDVVHELAHVWGNLYKKSTASNRCITGQFLSVLSLGTYDPYQGLNTLRSQELNKLLPKLDSSINQLNSEALAELVQLDWTQNSNFYDQHCINFKPDLEPKNKEKIQLLVDQFFNGF